MQSDRQVALAQIHANVERYGHHVYLVQQNVVPRFAYTIGLSSQAGAEIILAGANYFMADEVTFLINDIAAALRNEPTRQRFVVGNLGAFSLRRAHDSWSRSLMLGALDYYQRDVVHALQVVPDPEHITIDVPDCSQPWSTKAEPVWQWLHSAQWQFPVPSNSTAVTDLEALRGRPIVEAARWEEDQWELFSGPGDEFSSRQVRVVPIGTLLASDESLNRVLELEIGDGLLRDGAEWRDW